MCTELLGSGSFVAMLEYLLVVGNFLNKNAGKMAAKGFRLSSLSKVRHPALLGGRTWGHPASSDITSGRVHLDVSWMG